MLSGPAVLKLVALCVVVAGILEWCHYGLARWVIAIALVVGTRLLAEHVDVRKRLQTPLHRQHASSTDTEEELLSPDSQLADTPRQSRQHRDRDSWRKLVGSDVVAAAWDKLCSSVIQEFIYDAWFSQISPDREFPAEVRWQLNHAFGQASRRAKRLDWTSLLIRDCSTALCSTLQLYRTAVDALGAENLKSMPAAAADAAIRDVLSQTHALHPAFSRPDGQYRVCKRLADAVLTHVLPADDRACPMMRTMLRELFAACVIRSTLCSLAPYSINKLLLNVMAGGANQRPVSAEMLSAAEAFQRRGLQSSRAEVDHINQQRAERKSRRSLIGAGMIVQEGLAKALPFRSSMKRSKSHGDVKDAASRSPMAAAAAAAAGVAPATVSKPFAGRWRDAGGAFSRGGSANLPVGQQQQVVSAGVGAVRAAAQQLSLRKRLGSDTRPAAARPRIITTLGCSPPSSLGTDSPRSWSAADLSSSSPDHSSQHRTAASTRAISAGGAVFGASGALGWGDASDRSQQGAGSSSSSSGRSPVVAALCGLGKGPFSCTAPGVAGGLSLQLCGKLRAQVVTAEMLNLDGKACIVYKVRVRDDRGEWTVTRRYRHFEALHKRLKDAPHYKDIPAALPPKRLLTARDAPFVMKRRDELDCYLQGLLHSPFLSSNTELQQFLSQHSEVYSMAAAADGLQGIRPAEEDGALLGQRTRSEDVSGMESWRIGSQAGPGSSQHSSSTGQQQDQQDLQTQQQQQQQTQQQQGSNVEQMLVRPSGSSCGSLGASSNSSSLPACAVALAAAQAAGCRPLSGGRLQCAGQTVGVMLPVNNQAADVGQRAAGAARAISQPVKAGQQQHALVVQQQPHQQGYLPVVQLVQDQEQHHQQDSTELLRWLQQHQVAHLRVNTTGTPSSVSGSLASAGSTDQHAGEQLVSSDQTIGRAASVSPAQPHSKQQQQQDKFFVSKPFKLQQQQQQLLPPKQQSPPALLQHKQQQQQQRAGEPRLLPQALLLNQQVSQKLEPLDSVDPNFMQQQSAAMPLLPSSPPVPNKILPQSSVVLDSMESWRSAGTARQLSRQESDAAHQIEVQHSPSLSDWGPQQHSTGSSVGSGVVGNCSSSSSNSAIVVSRSTGGAAAAVAAVTASAGPISITSAAGTSRFAPARSAVPAEQQTQVDVVGKQPESSTSDRRAVPTAGQALAADRAFSSITAGVTSITIPHSLKQGLQQPTSGVTQQQQLQLQQQQHQQRPPAASSSTAGAAAVSSAGGAVVPQVQAVKPMAARSSAPPHIAVGPTGAAASAVPAAGVRAAVGSVSKGTLGGSPTPSAAGGGASVHGGAAGASSRCARDNKGDDWQDCMQDSTGLIVPLYELVSCVFELENKGFVRRPVITLVRQLLSLVAGGAIDELLQKTLANGLSEASISRQILRMQTQLWPGGLWFARVAALQAANEAAAAAAAAAPGSSAAAGSAAAVPPRGPPISAEKYLDWTPPADCDEVAEQVRQKLFASNVPAPLLALLGKNAYYKSIGDIYGVLQSKTLMYHLGLTVMETVLLAMFPEIRGTVKQMHQSL